MKRLIAVFLCLCLMAGIVPVTAESAAASADKHLLGGDEFPLRYDLRDYGVVTPVRYQNPWSTCWSFGGIAAAETSILTTMGMTCGEYEQATGTPFDLSEKHLAWFASRPITAQTEESQAGEGLYFTNREDVATAAYSVGGKGVFVTTLFAAGVGPVYESYCPYRGAGGITELEFNEKYPEKARTSAIAQFEKGTGIADQGLTLAQLYEKRAEIPDFFRTILDTLYRNGALDRSITAGNITWQELEDASARMIIDGVKTKAANGTYTYSGNDDWTIPDTAEDGTSNRDVYSGFTLVDGNILPQLTVYDGDKWIGINEAGMRAVKSELLKGRAVSISFYADQSLPTDDVRTDGFMNLDTWAQYTDEERDVNHAVCIVGWDDSYPRENFNEGHLPEGDGAWIVKNSWGSETEYDTREDGTPIGKRAWGVRNAEGLSTGYFYLSYYDRNLTNPETMVFDFDMMQAGGLMSVFAYDYMPAIVTEAGVNYRIQDVNVLKTANVFTNTTGREVAVYGVSTRTASPRARVEYAMYRLKTDAQNPEDGEYLGKRLAYYDYAGFHREALVKGEIRLQPGERIAVVVTESVTDNDGVRQYEFAANQSFTKEFALMIGAPMYGVAVVNKGESFVYQDGQWTDWLDYDKVLTDSMLAEFRKIGAVPTPDMISTDNFSIKLYVAAEDDAQDAALNQSRTEEMKAPEDTGKPLGNYTEKKLPVYRESMDSDETVNVRMYGDIPYMKIDEYYNRLYFTGADAYPEEASEMTVTRSGSRYVTVAYNGVKGTFDVDADTLSIENLETYTATPYYTILLDKEGDPSAPFVRNTSTDYTGEVRPVTVDLGQYGLDVIGDGDELWVPLGVLQYTFCSPYSYVAFCNGKGIYIEDGMSILQKQNAKSLDPDYYDFTREERSQEKIDYDYGCLCYYVDTFYGYPERSRLADSIRAVGLDRTLDKTIDGMNLPLVRQYLKSKDMGEYALGLLCLFMFGCDDGGHTAFNDVIWAAPDVTATWKEKRLAAGTGYTEKTNQSEASMEALGATLMGLDPADYDRFERLEYSNGDGAYYMEKGDTAMFVVAGSYFCDRAGWTAYYNDTTVSNLPADTLGSLSLALEKARSNAAIRKFVVNIAMCNGGESGFSTYISKLMSGRTYRHQFNEFSGQDEMLHYHVDMNFDRVFDEKDDEVTYPFTFAVVAGPQSYSAANYLANMAKDNGIILLGETTGGGACAPQHTTESEGLTFNLSSRYKLMDKNNRHVDFGVEPDFVLTKDNNGTPDYSDYFNLEVIGSMMDKY